MISARKASPIRHYVLDSAGMVSLDESGRAFPIPILAAALLVIPLSFLSPFEKDLLLTITTLILVIWAAWVGVPRLLVIYRWFRWRRLFSVHSPKTIPVGSDEFVLNLDVRFWWKPIIHGFEVNFLGASGEQVSHQTARVFNAADCVGQEANQWAPGQGNHGRFRYENAIAMGRNPGIAVAVQYEIPDEWSGNVQLILEVKDEGSPQEYFRKQMPISAR